MNYYEKEMRGKLVFNSNWQIKLWDSEGNHTNVMNINDDSIAAILAILKQKLKEFDGVK